MASKGPAKEKLDFVNAALEPPWPENCILWPYKPSGKGYPIGSWNLAGKPVDLYVYVCSLAHGPTPRYGYEVAHLCSNRKCLNPAHLLWSSIDDNAIDRFISRLRADSPLPNLPLGPRIEARLALYPPCLRPRFSVP